MRQIFRRRALGLALAVPLMAFAALPAHADTDAGGGAEAGLLQYTTNGIPLPPHSCVNVAWSFKGNSQAAVVIDLVNNAYDGTVNVGGGGSSSCGDISGEFGNIPPTAPVIVTSVVSPTQSTISCTDLNGPYFRIGLHLHFFLSGHCKIQSTTSAVSFANEGELQPLSQGTLPDGGTDITKAAFDGAFAVALPF